MATPAAGQLPIMEIAYLHGEPRIIWEEEEVDQMIINEELQYAVIGKFSYGWSDIQDLRKLILKQCDLKREMNIGLLSNRYILIRATLLEDYVSLLSKPQFYITHKNWSYPMRTLKWDPLFNPEEETSIAIEWISFPSLPPNFFGKEAMFSLAAAVGKPLQEGEHKNGEELPTKEDTTRENMGQDETAVANSERIKIVVICKSKDSHADAYSGVKDSANRDIRALSLAPSSVQILENEEGINQRSEERKKNDDERPHTGQEKGHSQTGESDTHNRVQEILKAPVINKLTKQEKTKKNDTEKDECMQRNIESIGREGDLSPRQINQLQGKNKKGEKLQAQSQINTRSKKGSTSTINQ
ncbi:hypothetical protein H5410_013568 [Solanum commersonii]|uniref:DUF4283 domain-containing protein n=1 Tax=Solanum commersonii TaxID=4109 RepID=A0A9J5ZNL2_SOLCO|nr:hypothetical protein H5410_013568 [Solanum commersonii]